MPLRQSAAVGEGDERMRMLENIMKLLTFVRVMSPTSNIFSLLGLLEPGNRSLERVASPYDGYICIDALGKKMTGNMSGR
jgi:hypothetical protein